MPINSRRKGSTYERLIAKKFEDAYGLAFCRTPQSGGFHWKGDITPQKDLDRAKWTWSVECKNNKNLSVKSWIEQAKTDADYTSRKEERTIRPVVVFHLHNTAEDYVVMTLEDFLEIGVVYDTSRVLCSGE